MTLQLLAPELHLATAPLSVAELLDVQADRFGSRSFVEHANDGRSLSFLDVTTLARSWIPELRRTGVTETALVAIGLSDPIEFAATFLSLLIGGYWVIPVDPASLELDAEHCVDGIVDLGAQLLITRHPAAEGLGLATLTPPAEHPMATTPSDGLGAFDRMSGGVLLSSSGTTGTPKSIRLGIEQLLRTAGHVAQQLELTPEERGLCPLPLFHINAEVVGLLSSVVAGSTIVFDERFRRTGFWETVARVRATWVNAVPAIVTLLANVRSDETVPPDIRFIRSASAPLPGDTMAAFEAATGIPVVESYGMTEAASQITANPVRGPRKPGSVGLPVGVDLRIDPLVEGEIGEVQIMGASVITHYEGHRHAERFTPDGWLRTGDIGRLDEDGYLFLLGRADDVINRSGEKVFPREIEEVLASDNAVQTAVVVPRADKILGQIPIAFILPEDNRIVSDPVRVQQLAERLEGTLARSLVRTKRPAELLFVTELPTGPTGKILRRKVAGLTPAVTIYPDWR